ncbi:MAG: hypothetical protein ACP5E3_16320 [Bacteroidales bacterium]
MNRNQIKEWLLDGDISIHYQVYRDLLGQDNQQLRSEIHKRGWTSLLLKVQNSDGHWGNGYYQPKWTSTHYTLLQLRNLWVQPEIPEIQNTIQKILVEEKGKDGGFNCQSNRKGAVHSSLHSTISVLEGMREYYRSGYKYRIDEVLNSEKEGQEFILQHRLYKSDKTGKVIKDSFLRFPYPHYWYYDILRALDYFRYADVSLDTRMTAALNLLLAKRKKKGYWVLNARYPGREHFSMETPGKPSRWNTLRALRVLEAYELIT